MRSSADWDNILEYAKTSKNDSPPWAVMVAVAALIGDGDPIEASWVEYEPVGPTTWTVLIVTKAKRLVYSEVQFKAAGYDGLQDQNDPADATVNAAWVRPLRDVVKLKIGKVGLLVGKPGMPVGVGNDWFPVGDVKLTFGDGEIVSLGFDQAGMGEVQRRRSDDFLRAVRAGIGW